MRAIALVAVALALAGCKKKEVEPSQPPVAADARVAKPIPREALPRPEKPRVRLADLESPDPKRRLSAVRAIAKSPPKRPADIARILALLGSDDPGIRLSGATALTYVTAPETTEPLKRALQDTDPLVAFQALKALARRNDPAALPGIVATLESDVVQRRTWAVQSLGRLGEPAKPHWKKLLPLLSDPAAGVRLQAVRAIGRLGDATAIDPIVAAANQHKGLLLIQARLALGDLAIDTATRQEALARIPAK